MAKSDDQIVPITPTPPISNPVKFGLAVISIFFGTFILWSLLAPIESAAIAPGKVVVDSNRKTIQHLEGGIVKELLVRDGSNVKKGDLLIRLDNTQAKASLELLRGQAVELLAAEARLKAERDGATEIAFPKRLKPYEDIPEVKSILVSQRAIFDANKKTLSGNLNILEQRKVQLEKEIESLDSQVKAETKQLKLIQEEIEAVAFLEKRKLIEKPRLLALQRESARLLGDRGEHIGLIAKAQQKIGETSMQLLTTKDKYQKDVLDQLRDTQQRLADILQRTKAAQDVLDRTNIVAPQSGKVVGLTAHTIGGVIAPGKEVLYIIPSDDKMIIEARVNPLDIDVVHEGLLAKIQFTAFKSRSTPVVDGVVKDVSADSFEDPNTREFYYKARISIDKEQMARLNNVKLYPGMPAQVMIIIDKQSPFDYFVTPIKSSFDRAFREQ